MSAKNDTPKYSAKKEIKSAPGEFEIIARYFAPLATHQGAFGLTDDAAAIAPPTGSDLVLTTDTLVSGIHFFNDDPADTIARKALRVNLSDLAAKGATPIGYLLSLSLHEDWSENWLEQFAKGLKQDQKEFGVSLLGGDTVRTPGPLTISITAFGSVPNGFMVRRRTGDIGDKLYVSGTIGDSALGLQLRKKSERTKLWSLSDEQYAELQQRYLIPRPRVALAPVLLDLASAAMDVSDGLIGDLTKMLCAGEAGEGLSAEVMIRDIPLSAPAMNIVNIDPDAMSYVLAGGDDYEVLAAISPKNSTIYEEYTKSAGIAVKCIGRLVQGEGDVAVIDQDGSHLNLTHISYAHF